MAGFIKQRKLPMLRSKVTSNPSMLMTIHGWWERGLISDKECDRMRKEALEVNIYKRKATNRETLHLKNNDHKTFQRS